MCGGRGRTRQGVDDINDTGHWTPNALELRSDFVGKVFLNLDASPAGGLTKQAEHGGCRAEPLRFAGYQR